jgi:hypothetical protein
MKSDSHRNERELTHPVSEHPDRQPANISHGDGLPHHHTHPSVERRFNREAEPVEVHHYKAEPHDPAVTGREHRERLERHARRH